jgi:hypothetical protein
MNLSNTLVTLLVRTFGEANIRQLLLDPSRRTWYWRIAPWVSRQQRYLSPGYVDSPVDPFQLFHLDPDRITRFTGRPFPPWTTRWQNFGAVVDGDWDQRTLPPFRPSYNGTHSSLYLAERFSETRLHEGLVEHFVDGVPWEDIDFVNELMDQVHSADSGIWQNCTTEAEIRQYCRELDRLYRDMRTRGCLSARELNRRENRLMTLRGVMENEMLVDITRTGDPVFVTGRHRLSIAKILGLDQVPVAVVVRHPRWVARHGPGVSAGPGSEAEGSVDPEWMVGEPIHVPW